MWRILESESSIESCTTSFIFFIDILQFRMSPVLYRILILSEVSSLLAKLAEITLESLNSLPYYKALCNKLVILPNRYIFNLN